MGERFRADFGSVRVHDGTLAHEHAEALDARAYTVGEHIVLGRNAPPLSSDAGKRTLAHELAHVVQQRRGGPPPALSSDAPHEVAADRAASAVVSGSGPVSVGAGTGVGVAREEDDKNKKKPQWARGMNPDQQRDAQRKKDVLDEFKERAHDPKAELAEERTTRRSGRSEQARHADRSQDVDEHHGFPKFIGGNRIQSYIKLTKELHYLYHEELYLLLEKELKALGKLPKEAGRPSRKHYGRLVKSLTPQQQKDLQEKIIKHAREFDGRYRMRKDGGYPDKRQKLETAVKRGIREADKESAAKAKPKGAAAAPASGAKAAPKTPAKPAVKGASGTSKPTAKPAPKSAVGPAGATASGASSKPTSKTPAKASSKAPSTAKATPARAKAAPAPAKAGPSAPAKAAPPAPAKGAPPAPAKAAPPAPAKAAPPAPAKAAPPAPAKAASPAPAKATTTAPGKGGPAPAPKAPTTTAGTGVADRNVPSGPPESAGAAKMQAAAGALQLAGQGLAALGNYVQGKAAQDAYQRMLPTIQAMQNSTDEGVWVHFVFTGQDPHPDSAINPVPMFSHIELQEGSRAARRLPATIGPGGTHSQIQSTWLPPGQRSLKTELADLWDRQKRYQGWGEREAKRTFVGRFLLERKQSSIDLTPIYDARAHLVSARIALEQKRPGAAEESMKAADELLDRFLEAAKQYTGKQEF